jgi:hypothetical protein
MHLGPPAMSALSPLLEVKRTRLAFTTRVRLRIAL